MKRLTVGTIYKSTAGGEQVAEWCHDTLARASLPHVRETWATPIGRTHLLFAGDGSSGRTVILVPGTNFNAATCLREIGLLAEQHAVIALDVPGQPGLSSGHRVRHDRVPQLGSWLSGVIDRLDRPVIVVGHSLGAAIAMSARSRHISARVLLSPAGLRRLQTPPGLLASSTRWLLNPGPATSERLLRHMCAPWQVPHEELVEWMTLVGRTVRTTLDPGRVSAAALTETARSRCVVATGERDVFVPPEGIRRIAREALATDVTSLPSGHLLTTRSWAHVSDRVAER